MQTSDTECVSHFVEIYSLQDFFRGMLNIDLTTPLTSVDWLLVPQEQLLEVTSGEVYRDDFGELTRLREALAWYPRDVWLLTLFGALLPAIVLMLLVSVEAERLRPGTGPIAALMIGAGSLMLPFSTVLFSHALSATVGFAGFTLLARTGRDASPRYRRMAVAGLLLGFAVVTEYPLALLALVSFVFVATQANRLRKLFALSAGSVAGVLPLPIYAWWAYGDPLHSTYAGAVLEAGTSGHDVLGANGDGCPLAIFSEGFH